MRRSWKPLYREVPGVRIPLSPHINPLGFPGGFFSNLFVGNFSIHTCNSCWIGQCKKYRLFRMNYYICKRKIKTGVAQLAEHWSPKPGVGSSSLSSRADSNHHYLRGFIRLRLLCFFNLNIKFSTFCFLILKPWVKISQLQKTILKTKLLSLQELQKWLVDNNRNDQNWYNKLWVKIKGFWLSINGQLATSFICNECISSKRS